MFSSKTTEEKLLSTTRCMLSGRGAYNKVGDVMLSIIISADAALSVYSALEYLNYILSFYLYIYKYIYISLYI